MYLTLSRPDLDEKSIESFKSILAMKYPELITESVYEYRVGGKLKLEYADCEIIESANQEIRSMRTSDGKIVSLLDVMEELHCTVKFNRDEISDSEFRQKFQRYSDPGEVSESTVVKVSASWMQEQRSS